MTATLLAANAAWTGLVIALWTKRLWETHYARLLIVQRSRICLSRLPRYRKRLSRTMFWGSTRKDHCNVFRTRLLSFARDCFFVGRNGVRAGPARAICPTGANSQSQQFAGRPAAASGSGLAGGPAGIARRIRIQRIRNGRVLARHQRGSQSAAQCAAPFPSTPARSALNQTRRYLSSV